jgi:hypothetical protein
VTVLQIEHKVPNYNGWKKAFDSDPINRKESGVRRHRIFRPTDDPDYIIIQLEFETLHAAEEALTALRKLWTKVEGKVMVDPQTRMLDIAEAIDY